MLTFQPTEIHTQANYVGGIYTDHSDHMAVGRFTKNAYAKYEAEHFDGKVTIPIKFYIGYPIHSMPANVFGTDLEDKENIFSLYTQFDNGTCRSKMQCLHDPAYGAYLPRQYLNDF
jgi:hypothetical protein